MDRTLCAPCAQEGRGGWQSVGTEGARERERERERARGREGGETLCMFVCDEERERESKRWRGWTYPLAAPYWRTPTRSATLITVDV